MKTKVFCVLIAFVLLVLSACTKDNDKTGLIQFKTTNSISSSTKSSVNLKSLISNPPLTGDTTETFMTSLKFCVGDVWVSQGEVMAGNSDDLEWIRLTDETNTELKLFENHVFSPKEIPAGTYTSIKITFRNIFYRHVVLTSDPSVSYELLETMGSSFANCDENDESWVAANYFSTEGNHKINDKGVFEIVSEGEKIGGFTIEEGKTAVVSWRLGAGATGTCTILLIDENGNREWDCGVDYMDIICPPDVEYMWDFVVEYE